MQVVFLSMGAGKDTSEILEYQVTILLDGNTVVEKDGCLQKLISRFLKR